MEPAETERSLRGQCHCGAIVFAVEGAPAFSTLCHCRDCRRQSGAPATGWAMFPAAALSVQGEPRVYASSETGRRSSGRNGTGLFFSNAMLERMGFVQVRIAACDDPDALAPRAQVQTAERIAWMRDAHALPEFARFPG